jgi:hypothetical protein
MITFAICVLSQSLNTVWHNGTKQFALINHFYLLNYSYRKINQDYIDAAFFMFLVTAKLSHLPPD